MYNNSKNTDSQKNNSTEIDKIFKLCLIVLETFYQKFFTL